MKEDFTFMSYSSVNATRSSKKTTDRSGVKNCNSTKETELSLSQPIERKHICFHVKFQGRLFVRFTRKVTSKKSGTFPKRMVCPFSKWRCLKNESLLHPQSMGGSIGILAHCPEPGRSVEASSLDKIYSKPSS
jgi:hypothetical protein